MDDSQARFPLVTNDTGDGDGTTLTELLSAKLSLRRSRHSVHAAAKVG